jgi:hypothetical protein
MGQKKKEIIMHNLKVIVKLTILTLIFFGMIVYVTATPPPKVDKTTTKINMKYMPKTIKLINDEIEYDSKTIIKNGTIIAVANHDSIAVLATLDKYIDNIVIVANISAAPWFVKKWIIPEKLTLLKPKNNTAWIYDDEGKMKSFLKVKSDKATVYDIYIMKNNKITKLLDGTVKVGALDGSMTTDEVTISNKKLAKKIKLKR